MSGLRTPAQRYMPGEHDASLDAGNGHIFICMRTVRSMPIPGEIVVTP